MSYFLIVYRRSDGKLLVLKEFPADQADIAQQQRFALERQEMNNNDVEVIVLGASSLESLQKTHSRYFKDLSFESLDPSRVQEIQRLNDQLTERSAS